MHFGLRIALASLSTHKLRTVLAMLGVFLGALALTGVQHVSQAMVRKAEIETEKLGPNLFMARAGSIRFRRSGGVGTSGDVRSFKVADAYAVIQGLPAAVAGAPFTQAPMEVRSGGIKIPSTLVGSTPEYQRVRSLELAQGRFFTAQELHDREMVCVLGSGIAERLFGGPGAAVGREVYFYRARLRVVGVCQPKGADIVGTDQDEQVFVPLSTYMRRMSNVDHITGVYVEPTPSWPARRRRASCASATACSPASPTTSRCSPPATPSSSSSRPWTSCPCWGSSAPRSPSPWAAWASCPS
jgi:putative ABC transport system permease protein